MIQVSVIIPTHNRAPLLERALQSVLIQKGAFFETIIVDDGSTDGTRNWVEKTVRNKPNVKYFFQSNQGPSSARNRGIRESQGEWIALLDSDDEWLPGKLARQIRFFEENPDFLICQTEEIWIRNGRRVNPMKKHKKYGGSIFEKCLPLSMVSPSAVMMRREFFDRVGFFDESLPACEDYDLWLRASSQMPIGLIEKPYVIKYGGHEDQLSHRFPVMDRFRIQAMKKLLESGALDQTQRGLALQELEKKCKIVGRGAVKRGRREEGRYYSNIPVRLMSDA